MPSTAEIENVFIGIDIGATTAKVGLVDAAGSVRSEKKRVPTTNTEPDQFVSYIGDAIQAVISGSGVSPACVKTIGLAAPAADTRTGTLQRPSNLPNSWDGFPIRDRIYARCGLTVTFANDADAAAYGEHWKGSGQSFDPMIMLTLGTGIGGAIIVRGRVIQGPHSYGGECGHITVDSSAGARQCPCGPEKRGHLEAYAGKRAVEKRAREALETEEKSSLSERLSETDLAMAIMEEAQRGDQLCRQIILESGRYLGIGIASLVHVIDPEVVILGGGMTFGGFNHELGREFLSSIIDEMNRRLLPALEGKIDVRFATLGGDAGFIGAAGLACHAWLATRS